MSPASLDWPAIATVLSASAIGVTIPGANFVAIASKSLTASRTQVLAMSCGFAVVNCLWAVCSILGASALIAGHAWLGMLLKSLGCAYLLWFGVRLLLRTPQAPAPVVGNDSAQRGAFCQGLALNIANPKSLLYYCAFLSNIVPARASAATIGAMVVAVGLCAVVWYSALGCLLSYPGIAMRLRRSFVTINRLCGSLLIGLGLFEIIAR